MRRRKPILVADFTTNHMGNFNLLRAMADSAARTGCDYVKMQAKDVDSFYPREKLEAPYTSPYGRTYGEYRRLFEFGPDDFRRFDAHCRELGLKWIATVQDEYSLRLFSEFDLDYYKIASCNARKVEFLKRVADTVPTSKRIILSVGGSSIEEVGLAIGCFPRHELYLLHCVSEYPCATDRLRLGNLTGLRRRFGCERVRIGYSGHERGFEASLAAVEMGAEMIEKHFCMSRHSFVHHMDCALEPAELSELSSIMAAGKWRRGGYVHLPASAFREEFGMSAKESAFLIGQQYGAAGTGELTGNSGRSAAPASETDLADCIVLGERNR